MNNVIMSDEYPIFTDELKRRGFNIILSENIEAFISYERRHADMQCLIIDDKAFVLRSCQYLANCIGKSYKVVFCGEDISGEYPKNVPLNAAVMGKNVIARLKSLDPKVIEYCEDHGYKLINVNQGYAKCSCAIVNENALITADRGIYRSLIGTGIDVLLISSDSVRLNGADHGFIGGASGMYENNNERTLYFSGNIMTHPDCEAIKDFCNDHGTKICCLSDSELIDIGGMIFC